MIWRLTDDQQQKDAEQIYSMYGVQRTTSQVLASAMYAKTQSFRGLQVGIGAAGVEGSVISVGEAI